MGTDITLHQEVKVKDTWHHYASPSLNRDYWLFEQMCGARGDVDKAISAPKGVPEDASELTKIHCHLDYGHSGSWLGVDEIVELKRRLEEDKPNYCTYDFYKIFGFLFGNSWDGWKRWPDENDYEVQDVRFVFWFDC